MSLAGAGGGLEDWRGVGRYADECGSEGAGVVAGVDSFEG